MPNGANGHRADGLPRPGDPLWQRWAELVANATTSRDRLLQTFLDPRRDLDADCGYPPQSKAVAVGIYQQLYDREPIAARVVQLLPKESWQVQPKVYETEKLGKEEETPFEQAWAALSNGLRGGSTYRGEQGNPVWEYLLRADILSGIGHFGVLWLGLDDGQDPARPAPGFEGDDPAGDPQGTDAQYQPVRLTYRQPAKKRKGAGARLLFLRAFPESLVQILQYDANPKSPRFGMPTRYSVMLNDPSEQHSGIGLAQNLQEVHWSRIVHVCDTLESSEVFSVPRMRPVLNRLLDLRKLYGGSAEMYWRGAFPGLVLQTNPGLGGDVQMDRAELRSVMENWTNGLQRQMALMGLSAQMLSPTVVSPTDQIQTQLEAICIQLAVPKRIFMGSERGEMASGQDDSAWNDRLRLRQHTYLTPRVIIPFVDRLVALGVLPRPEGYHVSWPDLESIGEQQRAMIASQKTMALMQYVSGGLEALVPPLEFLIEIFGISEPKARAILEAVAKNTMTTPASRQRDIQTEMLETQLVTTKDQADIVKTQQAQVKAGAETALIQGAQQKQQLGVPPSATEERVLKGGPVVDPAELIKQKKEIEQERRITALERIVMELTAGEVTPRDVDEAVDMERVREELARGLPGEEDDEAWRDRDVPPPPAPPQPEGAPSQPAAAAPPEGGAAEEGAEEEPAEEGEEEEPPPEGEGEPAEEGAEEPPPEEAEEEEPPPRRRKKRRRRPPPEPAESEEAGPLQNAFDVPSPRENAGEEIEDWFVKNPFRSEAQRRWMHANEPEMAAEWEAETPKGKKLPARAANEETANAGEDAPAEETDNRRPSFRIKDARGKFTGPGAGVVTMAKLKAKMARQMKKMPRARRGKAGAADLEERKARLRAAILRDLGWEAENSEQVDNWCNQYGGNTCRSGKAPMTSSTTPTNPEVKKSAVKKSAESVIVDDPSSWSSESGQEKWSKSLSSKNIKFLNHYTADGYKDLNKSLRAGDSSGYFVEVMDKVLAKAPKIRKPITVFRAMGSMPLKPGDVITDRAYMSTSLKRENASVFLNDPGDSMVEIRIPKGARGAYMGHISKYQGEHEFLMPRDSKIRIISIENGRTIAELVL